MGRVEVKGEVWKKLGNNRRKGEKPLELGEKDGKTNDQDKLEEGENEGKLITYTNSFLASFLTFTYREHNRPVL